MLHPSWIYFKLSYQVEVLLETRHFNYFAILSSSDRSFNILTTDSTKTAHYTCHYLKNTPQFASSALDMRLFAKGRTDRIS